MFIPDLSPRGLTRTAMRVGSTAQNALEVARFGGLQTGDEPAPYDIASRHRVYRLRRYFPDRAETQPDRPVVLLVPPLMLTAEVYDVSEDKSAARILASHGIDPWVVDFGSPEHEEGGLTRTLTDHVLAVAESVDTVRAATGRDVHLGGYSQGGMFCYQAAAYRRSSDVASVITFGSPVDTRGMVPLGIPEEAALKALIFIGTRLFAERGVPGWATRLGFKLLDPVKSARARLDFLLQLHDREALLPREAQRRFLDTDGFVAFPGPALLDALDQFGTHNRLLSGGFVIDDRLVTLADITSPILSFVGTIDTIAPPRAVRAIRRAAPVPEIYEHTMRAGHFGLVVGSLARDHTWPIVAQWTRWRDGLGAKPVDIEVATEAPEEPTPATAVARAAYGLGLAANVGAGVVRSTVDVATHSVAAARQLAVEAAHQMPRLARIDAAGPDTRISAGLLLEEQALRTPDATFFLFADRGHTYAAAQRRFDNIVRGLIAVGVRQGDHVGVLMDTRPSALAVVVALNRLGAVAVVMRPDGSITQEARLGQVSRIITDPEHGPAAKAATSMPVLVLGGGGEARELGFGLTDMEQIDPDQVTLPAWYAPNPGRGRDLAFVLFTGVGENTRVNRITNRRWALSAFGTASAAALTPSDTVYSVTPIHHPSCLLTGIGGAVAAGARLALTTRYEPTTFWDEVRRYGVTVVSYTWTLVRELVEAPTHPAEAHHPVRLFVGSGMPKSLWRRTVERFAPAQVLEFYASTEGEAVLANVSGAKIGAKGRPLPGSAEVRVAAYDIEAGRLLEGPDGFAEECGPGEIGMLLTAVDPCRTGTSASPLRGLFEQGDAWLATDDLFYRDEDGDFWFVDTVSGLIRTANGAVLSIPIEDALGEIQAVDLAAAYGVETPSSGGQILVAAVTVRAGHELTGADLGEVVRDLPPESRPTVVRVVEEMPMSTWFRPVKAPLRAEGVPPVGRGRSRAWHLDPATGTYTRLDRETRRRLLGAPPEDARPTSAATPATPATPATGKATGTVVGAASAGTRRAVRGPVTRKPRAPRS
jgi:putative long chain acyl-CoA synthase